MLHLIAPLLAKALHGNLRGLLLELPKVFGLNRRHGALGLLAMLGLSGMFGLESLSSAWSKPPDKPTIVFFKANWSAASRDVMPLVQDMSSQWQVPMTVIDVDDNTASDTAKGLGLDIPKGDIPQVLLVKRGGVTLLFDGHEYHYGQRDVVRSTLLKNLQQALGTP
jgi:thiol-disulfide isomerase/thioredoxin